MSVSKRVNMRRKPAVLSDEVGLLQGLPDDLARIFDHAETLSYAAGSVIFTPGDRSCEHLYIVKLGCVDLYRLTASGKRLVTRRVSGGGVFGVRGLLGRTMQGNFAEAVADSRIDVVTREQVLTLLKRRPDMALRILENVCDRLRVLEERLVDTAYSPASVRLAYFLLTAADPVSGVLTGMTHEEIGNTIGAVRQTVTEALSLMRRQGLLSTGSRQIVIIDRIGLESVVRSSG
jgi:CRP-like cAMP-binding protein